MTEINPADNKVDKKPIEPVNPDQIRADEELASFLEEPVKDGKTLDEQVEEDKKKEPEKPVEPVIETKKEEPPAIDPVKLTEEISQKVAADVLSKLMPENATKEEKKDILDNAPWIKEKRDPTWQEALKYMGEINKNDPEFKASLKKEIMDDLEKASKEEEQKEIAEKKAVEDNQKQYNERKNTQWNSELADLEAKGLVPKVVNAKDENDPGIKARKHLFLNMRAAIEDAAKKGITDVDHLMSVKLTFYEKGLPDTKPPGANAPVAGTSRSGTAADPETFSAESIHNASFEDILSGKV